MDREPRLQTLNNSIDLERGLGKNTTDMADSPGTSSDVEKVATIQEQAARSNEVTNTILTAQDWNGPNDTANPQNWSLAKKNIILPIKGTFPM